MPQTDTIAVIQFSYTSTFKGGSTNTVELRVRDISDALLRQAQRFRRLADSRAASVSARELSAVGAILRRYRDMGAEFGVESVELREFVIASPIAVDHLLQQVRFAKRLSFSFREGGTPTEPLGETVEQHMAFIDQPFRMGFIGEPVPHF